MSLLYMIVMMNAHCILKIENELLFFLGDILFLGTSVTVGVQKIFPWVPRESSHPEATLKFIVLDAAQTPNLFLGCLELPHGNKFSSIT